MGFIDRLKAVFHPVESAEGACTAFSKGHRGVLHLPPSPRELIDDRLTYEASLTNRKVNKKIDQPLTALYRMYEHFVLDQHIELRNELEAFWYHSEWPVNRIPDPKDTDPERYAILACIPKLLVLAFNKKTELGLPRNAPAIFTGHQLEQWRGQPKQYEEVPPWVEFAPRLRRNILEIPHWDDERRDFVTLDRSQRYKASKECLEQGVVVYEPHIHFI